ncbi:MAG: SH3 domain-containing protein [Anaerolineae bacterium]|nr:SH3 domain-containing protein [Anaerolineae bacterium]
MKRISVLVLAALLLALVIPAAAQDMMTPSVTVSDQVSLDGTVLIDSAYSAGPGWVVIHIDNGQGAPGPVIGNAALNPGANYRIKVAVDTAQVTPTLFAMLHTDTGEAGVYEFGTVEGADGPVRDAAGNVITPSFKVDLIAAHDQMVSDTTVTIASVVAQVDGWLVVHQSVDGAPGPVAGYTQVKAGQNHDVVVTLDMNTPTSVLYPMLHVDTGTAGTYEFGTVQGADGPVNVNGRVAVLPIWTVAHVRMADQIAVHGDSMPAMDMAPVVLAQSVLAEVDGWLVIHTGTSEGPGPVAGFAPVQAGTNLNVEVTLDQTAPSAILWPMLHVDTGEAGVYEFGTVEGADGPVMVAGNVVTFPINAAPSIIYEGTLDADSLTVTAALIDAPGWLAIHANNNGAPGPVIGTAPLRPGQNTGIRVSLDPAAAGTQVFPMLHYDTNEAGVYEFGTVDGADGPVMVNGAVVVGPLALEALAGSESTDTTMTETMAGCTISGANVNLRSGPGTNFSIASQLTAGNSMTVVGQTQGADGFIWWNLENGAWVRSDVVAEDGDCASMPGAQAPAAPADQPPAPAATQEVSS